MTDTKTTDAKNFGSIEVAGHTFKCVRDPKKVMASAPVSYVKHKEGDEAAIWKSLELTFSPEDWERITTDPDVDMEELGEKFTGDLLGIDLGN